jgi:hypothetical protein
MKRRTAARTRSLRAPGWLDKPGALRSLDVCLDSRALSIDALKPFLSVFSVSPVLIIPRDLLCLRERMD